MIEIKWAKELENEFGNTILCGNFCHEDCDLYDDHNFLCRTGYGVESEDDGDAIMIPGPECPGPGKYILTRVEV